MPRVKTVIGGSTVTATEKSASLSITPEKKIFNGEYSATTRGTNKRFYQVHHSKHCIKASLLPKHQQSNVWTYTILCIRNIFASQTQIPQDKKVNEGNTSPTPNNRDTPINSGIQIIQIIVDPVSHKITTHKKTICSDSSYTKRRRV